MTVSGIVTQLKEEDGSVNITLEQLDSSKKVITGAMSSQIVGRLLKLLETGVHNWFEITLDKDVIVNVLTKPWILARGQTVEGIASAWEDVDDHHVAIHFFSEETTQLRPAVIVRKDKETTGHLAKAFSKGAVLKLKIGGDLNVEKLTWVEPEE